MQASPDYPRASSRRIVLLCGLAAATLTVAFAVYRPAFLAQMDDRAYDTLARSASVAPADARIAIVDVDERSLSAIGQWPWRRDLIAQLITRVRELGASVVALDVIFAEPDRYETSGRPRRRIGGGHRVRERPGRRARPSRLRLYLRSIAGRGHRLRPAPDQPADPASRRDHDRLAGVSRQWRNVQSATAGAGRRARPGFSTRCPTPTARCGAFPADRTRGASTRASRWPP